VGIGEDGSFRGKKVDVINSDQNHIPFISPKEGKLRYKFQSRSWTVDNKFSI